MRMYCTLTVLPSGCDSNSWISVRKFKEGAASSLSHVAMNASMPLRAAFACSEFASASSCSRLSTSPGLGISGMAANSALMRGSMRGSSDSLDIG